LLDQFVKERLVKSFFVSTEARILRFPHLLSSVYFEVLSEKLVWLQPLNSLRSLVAGGDHTALQPAVNRLAEVFFSKLLLSKHLQLQQLTACSAAFNAAEGE
jgi:hypothetical protein